MTTKKNRTTYMQLKTMANYLERNKEVLSNRGFTKNLEKWTELCNILNSMRAGPIKSAKEWKRVLIEWKYKTKKKFKANAKLLNIAEEKLISVLNELPYEDLDASEIQFAQVLAEENRNFNNPLQLIHGNVKEEFQSFDENVNIHELISTIEISKLDYESSPGPGYLPSTSNCDTTKQNEVMDQTKELSTILIENNESPENLGDNRPKRIHKFKRRKFRRPSNVLREELRRNNQKTTKLYKFLGEAMFKLAESNCKIAESNCKIAESNEKLAEVLNIYTKTKQK